MNAEYNSFSYFWQQTKDLEVPQPKTKLFRIDEESNSRVGVDTEKIYNTMKEWGVDRAFLRSDHKSAPRNIRKGSYIEKRTVSEIKNTIESLIVQHKESVWELGSYLILREQVDVNFCFGGYNHPMCHPEVRYMVDAGEVLYKIGSVGPECLCEQQYDYLLDKLKETSPPDEYANKVASAFPKRPYAIDFILDTNGEWYLLEANLNGVRWDKDRGDFRNMSGHNEEVWRSPEIIHTDAIKYARNARLNKENH